MLYRAVFFIFALITVAAPNPAGARSLNLHMWAEAFPEWVFSEFQKETGIKVHVLFFSNEDVLLQRLSQNPDRFDLVECSPSFVFQQLKDLGLAKEIDRAKFPYWKSLNLLIRTSLLDPEMKYMIPYMWGSMLIAVNPKIIDPAQITSFADLWKAKLAGRLLIPDDLRSVFSFTLLSLGYSPNDQNRDHWQLVMEKLEELITDDTVITTNSMAELLDGTVGVAVTWNGSIIEAMQANPDLRVIEPKEGTILWFDGFFIPTQAKNVEEAYEFLSFIFRPDICARLTHDTFYATTNRDALSLLPASIVGNQLIHPSPQAMQRAVMEEPLPGLMDEEQTLWGRLRSSGQ